MSINIRRFSTSDSDFDAKLQALLAFETAQDDSVDEVVAGILKDVIKRGDAADTRHSIFALDLFNRL